MIGDFRDIAPIQNDLDFDICIAGAGAAGITLGLAFAKSRLRVAIFEGGGFEPPGDAERDLYAASVGPKSYPLELSRLRYFGGTTNHWGGWCRPLDEIDFVQRDYIPLSGWPISRKELMPYYKRAQKICQIESDDYNADTVLLNQKDALLPFPKDSGFINKLFRFSPPTRFGTQYRTDLQTADNVSVFLHANVTNIRSKNGAVRGFDVATLDGQTVNAKAKHYILALGGIETPRLMLNSVNELPNGIGNHADFVGRCFMDHFGFRPGFVLTQADLQYFRITAPSGSLMPIISMSDDALRKNRMRNFCIQIVPEAMDASYPAEALTNPGFSVFDDRKDMPWRYSPQFINEPTPNPDSRVRLSEERDALGLRRVHLDWRFNQADLDNIGLIVKRLTRFLGQSGWGRVQHTRFINEETINNLSSGMHHMGTTRMSDTPAHGVVDQHCQVHAMHNLHIVGSSVFPTVGFSNPTLTIVALAERLADRLIQSSKEIGS